MKCPNCGNPGNVHRSKRRSGWEKFLSWVTLFRPYRCHQCNSRFWRLRLMRHRPPGERRRRRSKGRSRSGGSERSRGRSKSGSRRRSRSRSPRGS